MSEHDTPICDELAEAIHDNDPRAEYREVDPGLQAVEVYSGPQPDPGELSWDEVGLAQPGTTAAAGAEHPTVEYGGPRLDDAAPEDPATDVGQPFDDTVPEGDGESTAHRDPISRMPKYLLAKDDEAVIVKARIKELEEEAFRAELRLWELRTLGQAESTEYIQLDQNVRGYTFLVMEMVTAHDHFYGG